MNTDRQLTVADWHRLNGLLAEVLELEPPARTEWLAALREDTLDLKPLLERLLADTGTTKLEGTSQTLQPVMHLAAAAMAAMRREAPGDRIGPWQLERLIAEGGMGAVWVAQRADGVMKRTAALKLPRAEWVDHGLAARIARERAILARLQHPHIAVLYDAGLAAEGRPYLALEYVDGAPIDVWCKGRALKEVVRLFVQVVRAVAYAHGQLVIHRDLKPANVLVSPDGLPKLLDFGISKLIEGDTTAVEATALTRLAGRPMTLAYAAPEQVLGLPVTVAADVYALGVLLFELVTEVRLYRAQEPRALEAELLRDDLRAASAAAPGKSRARALRGDLDAIIGTALKRQPTERYQSAAALADDLERYLVGEPVRAQPDSRGYRLRKFIARNTLAVGAVSAVVVALGLGLGAALWQANEAKNQAARATAMNTFVLSLIRQADPNASQQTKAADLAMLAAIEQRIDAEFKGSPDQMLQLRVTVGDAYKNRGENAAALRVFQRAVSEAAPGLPADHLPLLAAIVRAADTNLIVSTEASQQLDHAIEILRTKSDKSTAAAELMVDALLSRSQLSNYFGVPTFTLPAQRFDRVNEALELATRKFGDGSRQQLRVLLRLANMRGVLGDPAAAARQLETAVLHARARTDDVLSSIEYLQVNAEYAVHLCRSPRSSEGLSMLWDSVAAARSAHGPNSVQLETLLFALSDCLEALDDPTSKSYFEEAFEVAAARERPPSTNLMRRAEDAFELSLGERNFEAAERHYQSAVENSQAIVDPSLREKMMRGVTFDRVCLLANRGDAEEAERLATPLVEFFEAEVARSGRLTPGQASLRACLSFAQRQNRRFDEAVRTAQTLADRCRTMLSVQVQGCEGRGLVAQALAELDAGRKADALATVEQRLKLRHAFIGDPNLGLAYGRALLANGRAIEAIEPLRTAYGSWLASSFPRGALAAEAEYWLGRAYMASGDVKRGRWMVAEAQRTLATSRLNSHQALARAAP